MAQARSSFRCVSGIILRSAGPLVPTLGRHASRAGTRAASTSAQSASSSNAALVRGVLAGAGLSLAAILVGYRTRVISIAGETVATSKTKYGSHEEVRQAIADLRIAFPAHDVVSTDPDALKSYGSSPNSYHPASPHSVVVHVTSTEDVVKVVNIARKYRVPIVAYSGATSLEGHFSGVSTFLCLLEQWVDTIFLRVGNSREHLLGYVCYGQDHTDQRYMQRIPAPVLYLILSFITEEDGDLICQAGARWEDINQTLRAKGVPLFFPVRPIPLHCSRRILTPA